MSYFTIINGSFVLFNRLIENTIHCWFPIGLAAAHESSEILTTICDPRPEVSALCDQISFRDWRREKMEENIP